jgi:hypothetical protein
MIAMLVLNVMGQILSHDVKMESNFVFAIFAFIAHN